MAVSVEVVRRDERNVRLWYRVARASQLRLSHEGSQVERQRLDGLWQTTCAEAFVEGDAGYYEFNFGPGGDWAAYSFAGHRQGMSKPETFHPTISSGRHGDAWQLNAGIDLAKLSVPFAGAIRLGVSFVAQLKDGSLSYWALVHPSDKPDFHHPDSFILDLP